MWRVPTQFPEGSCTPILSKLLKGGEGRGSLLLLSPQSIPRHTLRAVLAEHSSLQLGPVSEVRPRPRLGVAGKGGSPRQIKAVW